MVNHGMGSYTSPIVISDDEDDAFVEMQLEDRLSDAVFDDEPEDSYYYQDYDDRFDLEDTLDYRDEWYPDEGKLLTSSTKLRGVILVRRARSLRNCSIFEAKTKCIARGRGNSCAIEHNPTNPTP